jgi:quercetin dioxygenase-like cupin family protein
VNRDELSHPATPSLGAVRPASRRCFFDTTSGGFANILRISPGAKLPVRYHVSTVQAWTIQGTWYYEEHKDKWIAHAGTYVFEPPGELHTKMSEPDSV